MRPAKHILLPLLALPCTAALLCAQHTSLPEGTALRVELDRAVRIHKGATVAGHLTQPVYLYDHQVVPIGSIVSGTILGSRPGPRSLRVRRLLAADFTPPRIADIVFTRVTVPIQGQSPPRTISVNAPAEETSAGVLTLGTKAKKRSIKGQISDRVDEAKRSAKDTVKQRNFKEIIEKWAVGQLPYHPEILWSKTHFNARLSTPVVIEEASPAPLRLEDLHGRLPDGTLHARLLLPVSSEKAKRGDAVEAITTQPLLSPSGDRLLVPEGTHLHGTVVQTKGARNFGRNGSLRFTFSKLDLPVVASQGTPLDIHGRLSAAETSPGEHISMDEEGGTKASEGPAKYAEPALLAVLAAGARQDDDHPGTAAPGASAYASNGLGLISRIVSLSTRDPKVVQGFAYYSLTKSVYYRFIAKGKETSFPRDTEIQITLSER